MTSSYDTIIVGGGLSGLTTAHKLRRNLPQQQLLLLEASENMGGVIRSHRQDGYITEIGPHGFLDNCQESQLLLKETGLDSEIVKAPLSEFVRYVYLRGKLQCIPQTPLKICLAPLIPVKDKLRVLAELWQRPLDGEPTVAKWVNHRFGPALLPFADAVFTGTYAGDYNLLSMDAVMPGVRALEKEHGSVIRGLLATMRNRRKKADTPKKITMPAMTSFAEGMCRLPEKLTEILHQEIDLFTSCPVAAIEKTAQSWIVQTPQGEFTTRNLVLATPTNVSLQLLRQICTDTPILKIPETWIKTVVFGFGPGVSLPPGFGYLIPESEGRFTLGSLFSSNMFPNRAPQNHVVFETLVGGRRHPERLELADEELTRLALSDVQEVLDIKQQPVYTTVLRSDGGIPQLERGYSELLAWRDRLVERMPGLHICGFGWEGIGLNEMMKSATRVAAAIGDSTSSASAESEVKKVYF